MKKRIKWNPRFITSLFIAFMCTLNCMAQNVIKGSVNDGSGEPLPGVSVAVKGTTSVLSQTWMESSVSMPEIMMY